MLKLKMKLKLLNLKTR